MPNKHTDKADYYRRENQIINAKDGMVTEFDSVNEAKNVSKQLQADGYKVVVLKPTPQVKGRY